MVTPDKARILADQAVAWLLGRFSGKDRLANEVADALRDLAAQVEALQADAERYRWLRNSSSAPWQHPILLEQYESDLKIRFFGPLTGSALDKKIDAEIEAERKDQP